MIHFVMNVRTERLTAKFRSQPKTSSWKVSTISEDNSVFESVSKTPLNETKVLPRFAKGKDSLPLKLPNIISSFAKVFESSFSSLS